MPKRWTAIPQQEFLEAEKPAFLKSRKDGNIGRYLSDMNERWFQLWPERTLPEAGSSDLAPMTTAERSKLEEAIDTRKKQLRTWLTGHSNKEKRQSAKIDISLFTQKPRSRAPQLVELYQTLYADKIKTHVDKVLIEFGAEGRSQRMKIRRATVLELFDSEDDEVIAIVQRALEEKKRKLKEEAEEDSVIDGERTPTEYHQAIMGLPSRIKPGLQALAEATGWVFFVAAAGPNPAENGAIYMDTYHFGPVTQAGNDFKRSFLGYEEGFGKPFAKYVTNCFPPDVRRARALDCEDSLRPVDPDVISTHHEGLATTLNDLLRMPSQSTSPTAIISDLDDDMPNDADLSPLLPVLPLTLPDLPPTLPALPPTLPALLPTLPALPPTLPLMPPTSQLPSSLSNVSYISSTSQNTPSPSVILFTPGGPNSPIENGISRTMVIPDSNIDPRLLGNCPFSDTARIFSVCPRTATPAPPSTLPSLDPDHGLSALASTPATTLDGISDTANEALNEAANDTHNRPAITALADYHVMGAVVKEALASQAPSSIDASRPKPRLLHRKRTISATSDNDDDTALNPAQKRAATIARKRAGGTSVRDDEATGSRDPEGSGTNNITTRQASRNSDRTNFVRPRVGTRSQVIAEKPIKRVTRHGGRK